MRCKSRLGKVAVGEVPARTVSSSEKISRGQAPSRAARPALSSGVFVGPLYTGKGLAGMLNHIRAGRVQPGSNIAFLCTGDTGNLFEIPQVVGNVAESQLSRSTIEDRPAHLISQPLVV